MRNLAIVLMILAFCSVIFAQTAPPAPEIRGRSWSDLRLPPSDLPVIVTPPPAYGLTAITGENADQVRLLEVIPALERYSRLPSAPIISRDSRFLYVPNVLPNPRQRKPMWNLLRLHSPRTFGAEQVIVTGYDNVFAGINAQGDQISLMNVEIGHITHTSTPALESPHYLQMNPDTILVVGQRSIYVFNRPDLSLRFSLPYNRAQLSPDGRQIIVRAADHQLEVYDAFSGECSFRFTVTPTHSYDRINHWVVDPQNQTIVVSGGGLHRWSLVTGEALPLATELGGASSIAFSPDGRWLALINSAQFNLIDTTDGRLFFSLYFESADDFYNRNDVTFSPDGRLLLLNNPLRLLNLVTGEMQPLFGLYRGTQATFSPDGATIIAYERGLVLIFGVPTLLRPTWAGVSAQVIPDSVSIRYAPRPTAYEVGFGIDSLRVTGVFDDFFVQVADPLGWTWARYLDFGAVNIYDLPRVMSPEPRGRR